MPTTDELDTRLAALEARLAAPLAANPPITVGELTDVPAPGSPIASQWAQEVSNRIVHRFATLTALKAWSAADGSIAYQTDRNRIWQRMGGAWKLIAGALPWVVLSRSALLALPSGALTAVPWTSETWDTDNLHTANATAIIVCPPDLAGVWQFSYSMDFSPAAAGYRYTWLSPNGNSGIRYGAMGFPAVDNTHGPMANGTAVVNLVANDYMELMLLQDSGVSMNVVQIGGSGIVARYLGPPS
jgi:hypothetical protein